MADCWTLSAITRSSAEDENACENSSCEQKQSPSWLRGQNVPVLLTIGGFELEGVQSFSGSTAAAWTQVCPSVTRTVIRVCLCVWVCSTSAADLGLRCHSSCVTWGNNAKNKTKQCSVSNPSLHCCSHWWLLVSACFQPQLQTIKVIVVANIFPLVSPWLMSLSWYKQKSRHWSWCTYLSERNTS